MSPNDDLLVLEDEPVVEKEVIKAPKKITSGQFFVVSLKAIHEIVKCGGLADDVMSYLVLTRHTQGRGEFQRLASTSGAKAIHTKTGIPYRKAVRALDWLEGAGFIQPMDRALSQTTGLPEHFGKIKTRATTIRWVLHPLGEPLIYLANALIDGTKGLGEKNPPLKRMIDHMPVSRFKKAEVKLDALMLLLNLYFHHELDEYGGVNPHTALYTRWKCTVSESNIYPPLQQYHISKDVPVAKTDFIDETLFYIADEKTKVKTFLECIG